MNKLDNHEEEKFHDTELRFLNNGENDWRLSYQINGLVLE